MSPKIPQTPVAPAINNHVQGIQSISLSHSFIVRKFTVELPSANVVIWNIIVVKIIKKEITKIHFEYNILILMFEKFLNKLVFCNLIIYKIII